MPDQSLESLFIRGRIVRIRAYAVAFEMELP